MSLSILDQLQRAVVLHQRGLLADAQALYHAVLAADPRQADALHLLGVIASQTNDHQNAVALIGQALTIQRANPAFYANRGNAHAALGQYDDALKDYDAALTLLPSMIEALSGRGNVLRALKRPDEAIASYDRAIAVRPDYAEAHFNKGQVQRDLGQARHALTCFKRALALRPQDAAYFAACGLTLTDLGRFGEAVESYDAALAIRPHDADTHMCRAQALIELNRLDDAVASFDKAISIKPGLVEAHVGRGAALQLQLKFDSAVESYDKALSVDPRRAEIHYNRGSALERLNRLDEALASYVTAHALDPACDWLEGALLSAKMALCDWRGLDDVIDSLSKRIHKGERASQVFPLLNAIDAPALHKLAAQTVMAARTPAAAIAEPFSKAAADKIRIGYYSPDFCIHPVAFLIAGLLEAHDRTRFDVVAFAYGPDKDDDMSRRIRAGVDQLIDIRSMSDHDVAALSRSMGIDIAVDLAGLTGHCRTGIFAHRAAPVQVNYLGYPGTMGAEFIDYIIADHALIPEHSRGHYAEKVARLPHCYQANDDKRRISARSFSRGDVGLPPQGMVFCCFNTHNKLTPTVFSRWMSILRQVDGSVLWLLDGRPTALRHLRDAAAAQGVDPARLHFAAHMPLADHLARMGCADLFLDTLPYTAHTTASDALWAGLPVLTCMGGSFAARVAGSLLTALGLPELIAADLDDYVVRAVALATKPELHSAVRNKLAANRNTSPLFNTMLFTRHIEAAYHVMHTRRMGGMRPDHFDVEP